MVVAFLEGNLLFRNISWLMTGLLVSYIVSVF